jgi:hypothetical protein
VYRETLNSDYDEVFLCLCYAAAYGGVQWRVVLN